MQLDHVRFYVKDAVQFRDWLVQCLGFQTVASGQNRVNQVAILRAGAAYFVVLSPLSEAGPVAEFLRYHPDGVADLAFRVPHLAMILSQAQQQGVSLVQPLQTEPQPGGCLRWGAIAAWGSLTHTLVERTGQTTLLPLAEYPASANCTVSETNTDTANLLGIDHAVLNVPAGQLATVAAWYQSVFGLEPQQSFHIATANSGLRSCVMQHAQGTVQLPINEPVSANSQIQEFLDHNRGAGIQHIALATRELVSLLARLHQQGLTTLTVPPAYYEQLQTNLGATLSTQALDAIAAEQILLDWQNEGRSPLLQTFTQPVFAEPTFFFELIERHWQPANRAPLAPATGFGEGNFRALFEAIEREQMKRGTLG